MALVFAPHVAIIYTRVDAVTSGAVTGFTMDLGDTVQGHLVRLTPTQAFEQFGFETTSPGKWLQNIDAYAWEVGDQITISEEVWTVLTKITKHNGLPALSHEVYLLERVAP